ncbi:hypothetical protein G3I60_13930 [Streptomyces sp. SID13666]|uniref:hypothetical protein n=1 Tax=unclassified Streptomyces TaxID=2593676 RepID=UPI0013C1CBE3|nr:MULTISPECIES: hypothetical protein [unclassified Streptomyces]NEA55218.1 hypothetical protein [Streptomyces sp. SID13666]NEA76424.1 hypothetical protein [Streptomyces sp. SID13588]
MTDDRLAIPLDALEDFAGLLGSITQRLNGTRNLFHEFENDLGDGSVAGALDHFESHWKDGRGDIDKQLSGLEKMATTVVREIRKVDTDLAQELEKATKPQQRPGTKEPKA